MNPEKVHVTRGEQALGIWPLNEVRELLASEFLLPTDDYWIAGQPDWLPLSQLPPAKESLVAAALERVGNVLRDTAQSVERQTKGVIGAAAEKADQQKAQLAQTTERLLTDYLPRLRDPTQRALAATSKTVEAALRDEVILRKVFGVVYDLLPRPVCRFVGEQTFVEFCLNHRMRLLKKETSEPEADSP